MPPSERHCSPLGDRSRLESGLPMIESIHHFALKLPDNHLPGLLLRVVVHDGPENHQLDAAALEERHLVLLAELGEAVDLFGHLDDSLDGKLSQVDYTEGEIDF